MDSISGNIPLANMQDNTDSNTLNNSSNSSMPSPSVTPNFERDVGSLKDMFGWTQEQAIEVLLKYDNNLLVAVLASTSMTIFESRSGEMMTFEVVRRSHEPYHHEEGRVEPATNNTSTTTPLFAMRFLHH
eukprot:TRINITY_DN6948_c0_g1_i1.p1 TRINITY_DN6948_c0_g1~~TRINITY_DN6948_c0_g1_i1.p1  ORF type:complete len:130 (-),score=28.40 TRINITY_DN6948_c0_g1_i1:215-604(-)